MPHWTQTAAGRKRMAEIQLERQEKLRNKRLEQAGKRVNSIIPDSIKETSNGDSRIHLATKAEIIQALIHKLEGEIKSREEFRQNLLKELGENA